LIMNAQGSGELKMARGVGQERAPMVRPASYSKEAPRSTHKLSRSNVTQDSGAGGAGTGSRQRAFRKHGALYGQLRRAESRSGRRDCRHQIAGIALNAKDRIIADSQAM